MAETTEKDSEAKLETDNDFDPTADILKCDDDETTMEEEEAMSTTSSCANELDALQNESMMPMEKLLEMYGKQTGYSPNDNDSLSNEEEIIEEKFSASTMENNDNKNNNDVNETIVESLDDVIPSQTNKLLEDPAEESEDDIDYEPEKNDDWKKTICIGQSFQATVPESLSPYGDTPPYENEDKLLWKPNLSDDKIEKYLKNIQLTRLKANSNSISSLPVGCHTYDDEEALKLLLQCDFLENEAIRRIEFQIPHSSLLSTSLWSEEETRNFENGLWQFGKNFFMIRQNKVKTRSVNELVHFYYLWKKTERHDAFAQKARIEKRKYGLNPGITDYQDKFLDEAETVISSSSCGSNGGSVRSNSPLIHSLIYGDPKRHNGNLYQHKSAEEVIADMLEPFSEKISSSLNVEKNNTQLNMPSTMSCADSSSSSERPIHINVTCAVAQIS